MRRSILLLLAIVALFGCRSSRKDEINPNIQTSVTNTPAPASVGAAAPGRPSAPEAGAATQAAPEQPDLNVKTENPAMASSAAPPVATPTTTTKPHKKVRKD